MLLDFFQISDLVEGFGLFRLEGRVPWEFLSSLVQLAPAVLVAGEFSGRQSFARVLFSSTERADFPHRGLGYSSVVLGECFCCCFLLSLRQWLVFLLFHRL